MKRSPKIYVYFRLMNIVLLNMQIELKQNLYWKRGESAAHSPAMSYKFQLLSTAIFNY